MKYYNDNGTEMNPNLHSLPNLCMSCKKKDDPNEEILYNLNRLDQIGQADFKCFGFEQKVFEQNKVEFQNTSRFNI